MHRLVYPVVALSLMGCQPEVDIDGLQAQVDALELGLADGDGADVSQQAAIDALETAVSSIDAEVDGLSSVDLTDLETRLDAAETDIGVTETDVTALETTDGVHTADIATNATAIAANTTDIAANTQSIAVLTTTTATHAADLTAHAASIQANTAAAAANTTATAANATAIGTHTTDIAANGTAIGTNATGIAANTTAIGTNTTAIGTNTSAIDGLTTSVAANAATITTYASAIGANTAALANKDNWDTAYGWGDHATAGYAMDGDDQPVHGNGITTTGALNLADNEAGLLPGVTVPFTRRNDSSSLLVMLTANVRVRYDSGDRCVLQILASGGDYATDTVVGTGEVYAGVGSDVSGHQQASVMTFLPAPTSPDEVTFTARMTSVNATCYAGHRADTSLVVLEVAP